jgi:hypothetical protein
VALDTRTRASIYRKLTPILGEEDANALMSEFPGSEGDELVTRSFLRAELSDLRAEFSDLRAEFSRLRADMASLETRLTLRMGAMGVVILSAMFSLKLFA